MKIVSKKDLDKHPGMYAISLRDVLEGKKPEKVDGKKAQLITNVMDSLTQAVVIGLWLLRKVVMSNHPVNKGKTELNTGKTNTNQPINHSSNKPHQTRCGSKE